jgi:transmembrane sensor
MSTYDQTISEVAARWYIRMRDNALDEAERDAFERWVSSNPAHQREYQNIVQTMQQLNSNNGIQSLASALEMKKSAKLGALNKAITTVVAVIGISLTALLGYNQYQAWQAGPVMQLTKSNPVGRIATQTLDDGSQVTLSANSEMQVTYDLHQRHVQLNRGEAIFEVIKDTDRPFVVETDTAKVTVLGTRFAVNRLSKLVRISVDHGRVQVESKQPHITLTLTNGQVAEVMKAHSPNLVNRNAADAFSFTEGKLVFVGADIDEVAETFSRYRSNPIGTQGDSPNNISAVINIKEAEAFLDGLPNIANVEIRKLNNQTTIISKSTK